MQLPLDCGGGTLVRGRGGGLQAAVGRAKGSKEEDFGLETEPTSANRRNQMKFQVSRAPSKSWPHS